MSILAAEPLPALVALVAPTLVKWQTMAPAARQRFLAETNAALSAQVELMADDLQCRREEAEARAQREQKRNEALLGQIQKSVLDILNARGLGPGPAEEALVTACADPDLLHRWIVRAAISATLAEVFAGP